MAYIHHSHVQDTIAALATPPGTGGIAIIRISGRQAIDVTNRLLKNKLDSLPSHAAVLRELRSPDGDRLDQALVLVMRPPRSFTGEETVEIHCHGGHLVARRILEALFHEGIRPANPGEFSMRAFLNGKIDLAQAEAIQDLIGAKNEEAVRVADDHLAGRLSSRIRELQQRATDVTALFEAWVDFPEDDLGDSLLEGAKRDLASLHQAIATLLATFHDGAIIHDGVTLCILGAPNVGKSSIMNALLGKDRAIVSPIAGTTRDMIEDDLHLNGIHCRLIDTAGIRTSDELIEVEGIKRTRHVMTRADVILAVLDASRPEDTEMYAPLTEVPMEKTVIVWNKIDCASLPCPVWDLDATQQQREVHLSALTGEGMDQLMHAIEHLMWQTGTPRRDEVMITSLRHKEALERAAVALDRAIHGLEQELSPEFIALDMRDVLRSLGSVIGTDITEDILNSIFSRFCIGK
jgi:tRNA modification GTPase